MAAPAAEQPPPLLVRLNEAKVKTTMPLPLPLPRAIQLVMAIVWFGSKPSTATTAASTKTIEDLGMNRSGLWMLFVSLPSIFIFGAAGITYAILCDDSYNNGPEVVVSGVRGFCFLAILFLAFGVYNAVLLAASSQLGLFSPRTPVAAWEAFAKGASFELFGSIVLWTSVCIGVLGITIDQAWTLPLLVAWTCLLGLLIASIVAFWLCVLRIYGGERRREKNSCGEAVIDGLAYLYCRLLYECAVRLHQGKIAVVADADAGKQQLDAHVLAVV